MNIFKSLSQGYGTISETNITSFLSFLLNSTNELDNSFILLFLELIDGNLQKNKLCDKLNLNQPTLREKIKHFSKRYTVSASPEFILMKDGSRQVVDILVRISDKQEADVVCLIIENKIKPVSANKQQVAKQFEYFKHSTDYREDLLVYSILITTDYDSFGSMYNTAYLSNPNTGWLRWTNKQKRENSLEAVLRNLLILEQTAEIHPINPNSQFIIKSFIDYIVTEYSNTANGQRNFSFNGAEEVDSAKVSVDNRTYILRRYDNKMIRVFDENDSLLEIEVRPLLKKINRLYNLEINSFHSTGTPKNTQVIGREIISCLNTR